MTFWAKLLTIVVCVLSIAFAGMSGVIFAKRQDFRDQLVKERHQHDTDNKTNGDKIAKLRGDKETLNSELTKTNTLLETKKSELVTAQTGLEKTGHDLSDAQTRLAAEQDSVKKLTQSTEVLTAENKRLTNDNEKVRAENADYITKLSAEQTRANDLAASNAKLTDDLAKLQGSYAKAQDTIRLNEEIFSELSKRNIEARKVIAGFASLPDIKAKVVEFDVNTSLAVLNVGTKQGVRKNFDFTVFRGDKFIATVNVIDVQDDLCAARVVTRVAPIQRGDLAWTRLQ